MSNDEVIDDFFAHYGVVGMKWGIRKNRIDGVSARTSREAKKDAQEFARAKMYYGKGAGTRRKLIKNTVDAKAKKDPSYKKAFDSHLANQDMSVHASKARSQRRHTDARESTAKTTRGVYRLATGGFGATTATAGAIFGAYTLAKKTGIDQAIVRAGKQGIKSVMTSSNAKLGAEFLKNL